jgi:hypothetical protein
MVSFSHHLVGHVSVLDSLLHVQLRLPCALVVSLQHIERL